MAIEQLLNNREPVDPADAEYGELLGDLQGNILSSHKKPFLHMHFMRFNPSRQADARMLIGFLAAGVGNAVAARQSELNRLNAIFGLASPEKLSLKLLSETEFEGLKDLRITSETEKLQEEKLKQGGKKEDSPAVFASFLLASKGYGYFGIDPKRQPFDPAFLAGMKSRSKVLNDPDPNQPEWGNYRGDVHAVLILGCDMENVLKAKSTHVESVLDKIEAVHWMEAGAALKAKNGSHIEPFGFRDGISQPGFYSEDKGAFASLKLALCPDPGGTGNSACGSYFVFRKLKQDVGGFHRAIRDLNPIVNPGVDAEEDIMARMMGRYRNGSPLAGKGYKNARPNLEETDDSNDFDFKDDVNGSKCPFHAHIRKANPRGDVKEVYDAARHRIARRSIPFGPEIVRDDSGKPKLVDGEIKYIGDPKEKDIGILFLCAQAGIEEHFEHLQSSWINNEDFLTQMMPGVDPIAGQLPPGTKSIGLGHFGFHATGGGPRSAITFPKVVEMRGGEYFFAPSIGFLRSLGEG